jgi:hypothetical protein
MFKVDGTILFKKQLLCAFLVVRASRAARKKIMSNTLFISHVVEMKCKRPVIVKLGHGTDLT